MPVIKLQHLEFSYKINSAQQIKAIRDLSLEIAEGEWVAIIGANGSGKTTLSKLLGGILLPTAGDVRLAGVNTKQGRDCFRPEIGMVLSSLEDQLVASTVEEDIAFGPENLGLPIEEIRTRVDEAANYMGLREYIHRAISELSGGERKRVALAGVLAMRPRCLILDEPTMFLAPHEAERLWQMVKWLNKEKGVTVLWFSQLLEQARGANRLLVLHEGALCLDDTPGEAFARQLAWENWGLELPDVLKLARQLMAERFPISLPVFTVDELLEQVSGK
jgi:energy-coupling factor transport system ATP-binding protein